eukprot:365821_1
MEQLSAKLHTSIGSFPSSSSLIGFLTSEDGVSPIKTYPVYVSKNISNNNNNEEKKQKQSEIHNNTLIILNEQYKIMHKIVLKNKCINHVSCYKSKLAISTCNDVRIIQKFGNQLRTLCILDEENVYNSCFFLDGNGICIVKKPNKITLYNINDIINRYHAQLDAIEKEKEKLKKRNKLRKGIDSSATTPKSVVSDVFSFTNKSQNNNDNDDDSEIDSEFIGDIIDDVNQSNTQQDINALVVRYRTLYIETTKPNEEKNDIEWNVEMIKICSTSMFWWIGIIDNFGILHVCKLLNEWPNITNLKDIISSRNTIVIQLWKDQPNMPVSRIKDKKNSNDWFIGIWTWYNINNINNNNKIEYISWYNICNKCLLIILDNNGIIYLYNE